MYVHNAFLYSSPGPSLVLSFSHSPWSSSSPFYFDVTFVLFCRLTEGFVMVFGSFVIHFDRGILLSLYLLSLSTQYPIKSVSLLSPSLGIISPSADRGVFLHPGLLHAKCTPELRPSSYLGSRTCFFLFHCGISNPRHQSINQEVCSDLALLAAP